MSRAEWAATYRESSRRLAALLAAGRSVVYDATNVRRLMRDRLRAIAAGDGAGTLVVFVDPPPREIDARRARNRLSPRRPDVPAEDFAEVREGFQRPGGDALVVRYDPTEPIDAWLGRLPITIEGKSTIQLMPGIAAS